MLFKRQVPLITKVTLAAHRISLTTLHARIRSQKE